MESRVVVPECSKKSKEKKPDMGISALTSSKAKGKTMSQNQPPDNKLKVQKMTQHDSSVLHVKTTNVFRGKTFCFSNLFPEERVSYLDIYNYKDGYNILVH